MAQLRQDYREFVVRETEVLVVNPDDARQVAEYWRKENLPMPGLVDPGHEVANQYGQQVKMLKFGRLPSMLVLDRSGAVRFEHRADNMQDIPQDKQILALLDELNREWSAETVVQRAKA
jgi:peroxiredoxin Q/BCP